jgi:hypothetical protein
MPSFLTTRLTSTQPKRQGITVVSAAGPGVIVNPQLTTKVLATGGNIIAMKGGLVYHIFLNTNDLVVKQGGNLVEILLVGGGGGAGGPSGQSGGGGGCVYIQNATLQSGTYTMNVGAGGAGSSASSGGDSYITRSGSVPILGDQDFGGLFHARAGGGGGGGGTHGSGNNPKVQGGGAGGRQSNVNGTGGAGDVGFGNRVYALRPVITNGGSGYTSPPTFTFLDPQSNLTLIPNTITAAATAEITNGSVTKVTITNPGYGYSNRYPDVASSNTTPITINHNTGSGFTVSWPMVVIGGHSGPTASPDAGTSIGGGGIGTIGSYTTAGHPPKGMFTDMYLGGFNLYGMPGPSSLSPSSNAYNNFVAAGSLGSAAASPLVMQLTNAFLGNQHHGILTGGSYYYGQRANMIWNPSGTTESVGGPMYGFGSSSGVYTGGNGNNGIIIVRYPA